MYSSSRMVVAGAFGSVLALLLLLMIAVSGENTTTCPAPVAVAAAEDKGEQSATTVAGLSQSQLHLARNGVAIGTQRQMPDSVIIAELAAQATESGFRNFANPAVPESLRYTNDGLAYDHDSVGPHQMRASVWGSVGTAALMDPIYQINWFYDQAAEFGTGVEHMSPAALAQAIEQSAPNAYAAQLDLARHLHAMFADIDPATMPGSGAGQPPSGCGPDGSGAPFRAESSAFGQAVIEHAHRWMGTPYVWGGGDTTGPTQGGFDCSGLTMYAIYHASEGRIRLPHYTQAQQDHPSAQPVPLADRAPGDLIFFTAAGDMDSHHVGIYYGHDQQGNDLLLHAPQSGETVTLTSLSAWKGERMDVRRYAVTDDDTPVGAHVS